PALEQGPRLDDHAQPFSQQPARHGLALRVATASRLGYTLGVLKTEIGLFTEFHCPPGMDESQAFDESLAEMTAAEELGFHPVWRAEILFQRGRRLLPSPLVVPSAIAPRPRRVKIGIAVQVLPLANPLRLAEDVATVDQISKGRLDFGVGRSGLPAHYHGF